MGEPRAERPYMPDYGVGASRWRELPWSWAAAKLAASRNYWLSTASGSGRPHALPVRGVWDDGEHRFAFSCGPHSRKAADLEANPYVALAVDDSAECLSLEGRAAVLRDRDRRATWIARYLDKYEHVAPALGDDFLRQGLVVEIVPARAFAVLDRAPDLAERSTRWSFDG
ncbi:pyridoxamine 5'-phosphate oxidase family protein [Georgenia thermotolerans]|uniref:Pyridoxamine 5'-phosphate oxidase n=1 Tax=Georgenia thermotolerans TaxID=527326 RepID=A0A7J5URV6_9MICO|nr:pyridoxamine 5'-phosphate oxidase family protein [Georgenia thermotolerans]KAE8765182.1 pyridoxamine 5'-phosphate oxidase [Georgenia thermotolerans]